MATWQSSARASAPIKATELAANAAFAFLSAAAGAQLDCFAIGVQSTPFFERLWLAMTVDEPPYSSPSFNRRQTAPRMLE